MLLDKARQFAGEYIEGLEQRPVFPGELSLQAMDALDEPLPEEFRSSSHSDGTELPSIQRSQQLEFCRCRFEVRAYAWIWRKL